MKSNSYLNFEINEPGHLNNLSSTGSMTNQPSSNINLKNYFIISNLCYQISPFFFSQFPYRQCPCFSYLPYFEHDIWYNSYYGLMPRVSVSYHFENKEVTSDPNYLSPLGSNPKFQIIDRHFKTGLLVNELDIQNQISETKKTSEGNIIFEQNPPIDPNHPNFSNTKNLFLKNANSKIDFEENLERVDPCAQSKINSHGQSDSDGLEPGQVK